MICRPIEASLTRPRELAASTVRSCSAAEIPSAGEQSWTNHQQCADDHRQHVDRPCTVRRGRCGREEQNTGETVARSRERDSRASGRYWAGNRHRPYDEASVIIRLSKEEHRNRRGGHSPNQDGSGEDSSPRHTGNRTNGRGRTLRSGSDPSPACGTARRPRDGRSGESAPECRRPCASPAIGANASRTAHPQAECPSSDPRRGDRTVTAILSVKPGHDGPRRRDRPTLRGFHRRSAIEWLSSRHRPAS